MRLFVGLRPSEEFRKALSVLQSRLQSAGVAARFLDPSNLHLTLAFIGEWPENVSAILPPVEQPFTMTLSGIGLFPEAKVIWAGVQKSSELDHLAQLVREKLTAADIPFDPKPFVPHITLGRKPVVPETIDLSEMMIPPATMTVADVYLYRSDRMESGMVYSVIGSSSERGGAAV